MSEDKIKKRLEKIAETEERALEEIMILFESAKLKIQELDPSISGIKVDKRALGNIKSHFNSQKFSKGVGFNFVPMGVAIGAKDRNKALRNEILKEWAEPPNRKMMLQLGKIITMELDGDIVPIKKIIKSHNEKGEGLVVDDGEICEPEDMPIPRDYRENNKYGDNEYENFQYSRPLTPNWAMTLFGIGYFEGSDVKDGVEVKRNPIKDGLVCRVGFYGDLANPKKDSFICNEPIWFMPCTLKVSKGKRTSEEIIFATAKSGIEVEDKNLAIEKIAKAINKKMSKLSDKLKKKALDMKQQSEIEGDDKLLKDAKVVLSRAKSLAKYKEKDYIPFIDLGDVEDYHYRHAAVWIEDEDSEEEGVLIVAKDKKSGWDKIDFNKFALIDCTFEGIYRKDNSNDKMILTDWSIDDNMFVGFTPELKLEFPGSASVLVAITTSRGEMVWDTDQEKLVKRPDEAVPSSKVRGFKVLQSFDDINIEEPLEGDA